MARQDRRWRKVLYDDQGVPDNYVAPSFLSDLKMNINMKCYSLSEAISASTVVTQKVSWTCLFIVIFTALDQLLLLPSTLLTLGGIIAGIVYILYIGIDRASGLNHRWSKDLTRVITFLSFGFGFAPVLKTLTETISTDTIYAMVTLMLLANLIFHDYGASAAIVSSAISVNAAIFAAICLASRLPTTTHAFTLLTVAVEIFVLAPLACWKVRDRYPKGHVVLTVFLAISALMAVATTSVVCAILLFGLFVCLSFVFPLGFFHLQQQKKNIYGPWDEAVITEAAMT